MLKEVAFFNAKLEDGTEVYIEDVKKGDRGFLCIDCNSEMIPVIGEGKRQAHFRHNPNDISANRECAYSNESYRHKVAKDILQIIKEIKVPAVYINRPKEFGGGSVEILPAKLVSAHTVLIERFLYEDEDGIIWAERTDSGRSLAVKPDVLFLDAYKRPILLIEIYSTNKVDELKQFKYEMLGIDAIEINISKFHRPGDIEASFYTVSDTKWLYNNAAKTIFDPKLHRTLREGGFTNKRQAAVFRNEPLHCRLFRVRDAIRSVRRYMEFSEFRDREQEFGISKGEVEAERKRIEQLEIEINNAEIEWRSSIESEEASVDLAIREAENKYSGLEIRYKSKCQELIREESPVAREEREISDAENEYWIKLEARRAEFRESEEEIRSRFSEKESNLIRRIQQEEAAIRERVSKIRNEIESIGRREVQEISRIDEERRRIETQIRAEEQFIRKEESELQNQNDQLDYYRRNFKRVRASIEAGKNTFERIKELETTLNELIVGDTKG